MVLLLLSLLSLLATSCEGQVTASPASASNTQTSILNQQLICSSQRGRFFTAWNHTFPITISTVNPVSAAPGDQLYFTNTAIGFTIPSQHVVCAIAANASQAFVTAQVNWAFTNAAQTGLTVFNGNLTGVPLLFTGDVLLRIPVGTNNVLDPIGPVTMGGSGTANQVLLSGMNVYVQPQDTAGNDVGGPVSIICGRQATDVVVASVSVGASIGSSSSSSIVGNSTSVSSAIGSSNSSGSNVNGSSSGSPGTSSSSISSTISTAVSSTTSNTASGVASSISSGSASSTLSLASTSSALASSASSLAPGSAASSVGSAVSSSSS